MEFYRLLDQDACRDYLIAMVHPAGPACPACGYAPKGRAAATWRRGGRVKCYSCDKFYTAWTGTIFSGARLDPRQLVLLFFMSEVCTTTDPIMAALGVSRETVWAWVQKKGLADLRAQRYPDKP